jgi:hypothetical protein
VSGWDASDNDMTKSWTNSPGDRQERHLDAVLAGESLPADADPDLLRVATALSALAAAPPSPDELHGQDEALAAFRDAFDTSRAFGRTRTGRRSLLTSQLSLKAAAVVATAGSLTFGGAAFAGVLPDAAQDFAHHTIGAPGATRPTKGPDPTGPAAFGLCTAWSHNDSRGHAGEHSHAIRNLAGAAGGHIAGYCTSVPHPSADSSQDAADPKPGKPANPEKAPSGTPSRTQGASGQHKTGPSPTGRKHHASSNPSGKRSDRPQAEPSAQRSTRPSARPSAPPSAPPSVPPSARLSAPPSPRASAAPPTQQSARR